MKLETKQEELVPKIVSRVKELEFKSLSKPYLSLFLFENEEWPSISFREEIRKK